EMLLLLLLLQPSSGLDPLVSQHPPRVVCESRASVRIECHAVGFQATTMLWYRQFPKQSLVLIATSNAGSDATYEQGFNETKFPIHHPNLTFSALTVTSAHPEDSSFYLCSGS
uniref:Ig-like domain-containing protein n=1 Tax=Otolemur garnettii TaxID=30611 RepID=H0XPI4_OTOGA